MTSITIIAVLFCSVRDIGPPLILGSNCTLGHVPVEIISEHHLVGCGKNFRYCSFWVRFRLAGRAARMAVGRQLTHSADAWKLLHGVVSVASFLSDEIN